MPIKLVEKRIEKLEQLFKKVEERLSEELNIISLCDKSTFLNFREADIKRVFIKSILYRYEEIGYPIFVSAKGMDYFGSLCIGDDGGVNIAEKGRKNLEDEYKGFLHTHVKYDAYPSENKYLEELGFLTDVKSMSTSGCYWLIMGTNPDVKKAVLRGYHPRQDWRVLNQVPERVLFKTEAGTSSEIRYDKGKINYLFEESEINKNIFESHLKFLEIV